VFGILAEVVTVDINLRFDDRHMGWFGQLC